MAARTNDLEKTVEKLQKEILERKRVEDAYRKSEEKYRTLTDNLNVAVFRTTPGPLGVHIELNPAFTSMFGFDDKKELLSSYAYARYQRPEDRELFNSKMLRDGAVKKEEFLLRKKDGTSMIGSITAVAIKDDAGEVKYYDGIIEDVTELLDAKKEAQKRRDEIAHLGRVSTMGELAASLAHEVNQPLAAILTNAQTALKFLKSDSPDLEEVHDILQDIVTDDKRAGKVIQRLRSFFRKGELKRKPLNINDVIRDVVSLINSEAIIRDITIETFLDTSLPPVPGDRVHLQQVILNFILNAAEAMIAGPDAPRIVRVSTRMETEQGIQVGITDSGSGIDKEILHEIMEPFCTTKPNGMGMGLSINRTIIEAHGGRVWAENMPGGGAAFHFTLPLARRDT